MSSIIEMHDVAVHLGGRLVLSDVNIEVAPGEMLSVAGPNGAGKTTLLRALLGLVSASGTIAVAGRAPKHAWRQIGYVPQRHDFAWDYPISAQQVVLTGRTRQIGWLRSPGKADHLAARRALQKVQLLDLADRCIGEMSGGQRQRVLMARALAAEPALLLLDEPFTGLDMPTQELLTTLFAELCAEGTTIVMTTHDLGLAMATSDRIALVNKTIVAVGSAAELHDPQTWMQVFGVSACSPVLASVGITPPQLVKTAC